MRFMIKAPIFSRQAFNMFHARSVLESTYCLFRTLATFLFSWDVTKTRNGKRGTRNGERGTGNEERGTRNGERGTRNGERGPGEPGGTGGNGATGGTGGNGATGGTGGNGGTREEPGTGNRETGTGVWERVCSGNPPKNSIWRTKGKKRKQFGET